MTRTGNEPIRILHVIGSMNRGGAEAMIMNLYRNIDRSNVQFDFVENTDQEAAFDQEIRDLGGMIYRCPHFTGKNFSQYKKWWKDFLRNHKKEYKVIHGHIGSCAAIYLGEAKRAGLYTIAHSHSSGTDYTVRSYLYKFFSYPTRYIADSFFACSKAAGIDRYGKRVWESGKCILLKNAIETNAYQYNKEIRTAERENLGVTDELLVGHIGRFSKEKNQDFVVDVFNQLRNKNINCKLILIGDGAERSKIEKKVENINLGKFVTFTGIRTDVNRLIQAIDFFVFPSIYEGLPVTLVEAQTSGLPCVISDKVPPESILTDDLVTVMPLKASAEQWAEHIVSRLQERRYDRSQEIAAAGYDIVTTAKWLEDFYFAKYNEQN